MNMKVAINYKFLNKSPMILGFEFFDCVQAVGASLVSFGITGNHLTSLILGFSIAIGKSTYKRFYPKNTFYFWKNKTDGVSIRYLIKSKREK